MNRTTKKIDAVHHIQMAIDDLGYLGMKDQEIIAAIRDLKFARKRIIEVLNREFR